MVVMCEHEVSDHCRSATDCVIGMNSEVVVKLKVPTEFSVEFQWEEA